MNPADVKSKLESKFSGISLQIVNDSLVVKAEDLTRVALFLKESPDLKMDYLSLITGVDYVEFLESVYHLYSAEKKFGPVILKVRVPRNQPHVPSLVSIYRGAEFQEREAFDMMGIIYDGHPDPRRIFMWEGFEGYPLRKDYIPEDDDVLEMEDVEWLERHGVKVPEEYKHFAEQLKASGKEARAVRPQPGGEA